MSDLAHIHPGEQLREEFMKPRGMTSERLAEEIGVPAQHVAGLVDERDGVSGEMALRLARYFGTSARFWLDMQRDYELERATKTLGNRLEREVKASAD